MEYCYVLNKRHLLFLSKKQDILSKMKEVKSIIKIEGLTVVYDLGKSSETKAVDNVSLEIYPQEYVIFFGPSGCGKSTLLYTIAGLEYATKGNVWVSEKNVAALSKEEIVDLHLNLIGMVFQAYYLIPSLTVVDNVILPSIFGEKPSLERAKKAMDLLARFGIDSQAKKVPLELSGGQQQRVAICRSLMNDPPIILADEPVGNLDSKSAEATMSLLNELNTKDKKTIILVTHDPSYLGFAHRVFHIKDGKITHVVTNTKRIIPSLIDQPSGASELERLARIFPFSPISRLKAKAIVNSFVSEYGIEEMERLEDEIEKFVLGQTTLAGLQESLDKGVDKGGVGLYREKARQFSERLASLVKEGKLITEVLGEKETKTKESDLQKLVAQLRKHLLDRWEGSIKDVIHVERLEAGIERRLLGRYDLKIFEIFLRTKLKDGGAGFNRRTAKNFSREIELVLIHKEKN